MLPKIHITSKKGSNKKCSEFNFVQKSPRAYVHLHHESMLGDSKDQYVRNHIMYRSGKLDSLWVSMLPKIRITSKKKVRIKVVLN